MQSLSELLIADGICTLQQIEEAVRNQVILGGKFIAVFITLVVQVIVLLFASALIFNIRWGEPLAVVLVALGLIVAAAGFGIMVMSFIKTTRQTGPVMGGVLTLTGMAGGLFTTGFQNLPDVSDRFANTGQDIQQRKFAPVWCTHQQAFA